MSEIWIYIKLGFGHIIDPGGYDHILFVVVLCAVFMPSDWKKVLLLVTGFTLGHSLTLALAALKLIVFNSNLIEFLIPLTILLTAIHNLIWPTGVLIPLSKGYRDEGKRGRFYLNYLLAGGFGLIHGMAFSSNLSMLIGGENNIFVPLLGFNTGLEAGQIVIVATVIGLAWLVIDRFGLSRRYWTIGLSGAGAAVALFLIWNSKFL